MSTETFLGWGQLALGAFMISIGYANRRAGHAGVRYNLMAGGLNVAIAAAIFTSGWMRDLAWAVQAVLCLWIAGRLFMERNRGALWVTLPFLVLMLAISVIEVVHDDLTALERTLFVAVALLAAALLLTSVVRLVRSKFQLEAQT
jgi:hypothetical protein